MSYLIDTDTVIYSLKGVEPVLRNFREKGFIPKAISVITYGELIYGARRSKNPNGNLARVYRLAEIFPVIDVTSSVMETFGDLKASLGKTGNLLDDMDLLIASTALVHGMTLVTNNTKHFIRIEGLPLENWTG